MSIKRALTALPLLAVVATSSAADDEWLTAASAGDMRWDMRKGSFRFTSVRSGALVAAVNGRIFTGSTGKIDVHQWYVSLDDCANGMGSFVTLDVRGEFAYENDFAFGAGSVASTLAEVICKVAESEAKKANDKSL